MMAFERLRKRQRHKFMYVFCSLFLAIIALLTTEFFYYLCGFRESKNSRTCAFSFEDLKGKLGSLESTVLPEMQKRFSDTTTVLVLNYLVCSLFNSIFRPGKRGWHRSSSKQQRQQCKSSQRVRSDWLTE